MLYFQTMEVQGLWIHRFLVTGFALSWIASWRSGFLVFRQKLTPEYHPLPGLIKTHVNFGLAWAVLLASTGLSGLSGLAWSGGVAQVLDFSMFMALTLGFVSVAVIYTGYGLKIGKPTGVWVHVFLVLISTGLCLILLSKYLWNNLS